jgi:hypothetical protein
VFAVRQDLLNVVRDNQGKRNKGGWM